MSSSRFGGFGVRFTAPGELEISPSCAMAFVLKGRLYVPFLMQSENQALLSKTVKSSSCLVAQTRGQGPLGGRA